MRVTARQLAAQIFHALYNAPTDATPLEILEPVEKMVEMFTWAALERQRIQYGKPKLVITDDTYKVPITETDLEEVVVMEREMIRQAISTYFEVPDRRPISFKIEADLHAMLDRRGPRPDMKAAKSQVVM